MHQRNSSLGLFRHFVKFDPLLTKVCVVIRWIFSGMIVFASLSSFALDLTCTDVFTKNVHELGRKQLHAEVSGLIERPLSVKNKQGLGRLVRAADAKPLRPQDFKPRTYIYDLYDQVRRFVSRLLGADLSQKPYSVYSYKEVNAFQEAYLNNFGFSEAEAEAIFPSGGVGTSLEAHELFMDITSRDQLVISLRQYVDMMTSLTDGDIFVREAAASYKRHPYQIDGFLRLEFQRVQDPADARNYYLTASLYWRDPLFHRLVIINEDMRVQSKRLHPSDSYYQKMNEAWQTLLRF